MTPDEAVLIVKTMVGSMWRLTKAQREALRVLLAERRDIRGDYSESIALGKSFQQRAEAAEARLREVEAERHRLAKLVQEYEPAHLGRKHLVAEVRALREALLECHGTEPSVNFTAGTRIEYCPLCDEGTWPCKVARLLAAAPAEGGA